MARQTKLIYALKDGEITSIADVESGLKCGCVCPACGEPLVAKKGSKVMHHFAHHAGTNCEYGCQTSLHLAAKDILSKAKKMVIPAVTIDFPGTYKRERVTEEKEIEIDRVELERRFDDIIPDVVVYSGGKYFFVEIFVTHRVNDAKLAKLKKANISTIEMNLSKIEQTISAEELREILLQHNDAKKWIYNASAAKWLNRFNQCAEKKEIAGHDFTQYVFDCPIQKHTWHGRAYARALEDCPACTYCIFRDDSCILCTGRQQVASIKDFLSLVKYGKPKGISCGPKIMPNQKGRRTAQFVALSWLNTMINLGLFGDAAGIRTVTGKDQLESTKLHCCRNDP